jgi:hypothetical protein
MINSYHGGVTETEIIEYVSGLSGVVTLTASEEGGAPAAAWGDTFFFYDPEGNLPENQRLPFTTLVIHDYAGWDTESNLDRDGIFRVNIAIGRSGFERLFGLSAGNPICSSRRIRLCRDRRTPPTPSLCVPRLGLDPEPW